MNAQTAARLHLATRDLLVSGVSVAAVGALAHSVSWVLLAGAVGPTAYVFAAHPNTETARLSNALAGHGVAIAVALTTLLSFGLWHRPLTVTQHPDLRHVAAAAVSVGVTVFVLDVIGRHHAPAAATAVLVGSALIPPGGPVADLAVALAVVSIIGAALARAVVPRLPSAPEVADRCSDCDRGKRAVS